MVIPLHSIARLTIISAILLGLSLLFFFYAPPKMVSENLLLIVPFFYLVNLLSILAHEKMNKKDSGPSKMFYLLLSGIKLILYLLILILYGIFSRNDVAPFFLSFLVFYLIYTFLDVKYLLSDLSK